MVRQYHGRMTQGDDQPDQPPSEQAPAEQAEGSEAEAIQAAEFDDQLIAHTVRFWHSQCEIAEKLTKKVPPVILRKCMLVEVRICQWAVSPFIS
jgi:hypothetical protein